MGRLKVNSGEVWHEQHQGPGTGMDADLLDGSHKSDILGGSTAVNPVIGYSGGKVSTITYADGTSKALTYYPSGALQYLDALETGEPTLRKTYTYDVDGSLLNVTQSILP